MIEISGDLFEQNSPAIGHGVNCRGMMGAGIAKVFRDKYPENYQYYRQMCKRGHLRPGDFVVTYEKGKYIYNIASQEHPGADARYNWLMHGLRSALAHADLAGVRSLAIPMIGCGIGGLDVEITKSLMSTISEEYRTDLTLVVP